MVHRDFKPANVLVGDDGRVRVVDFGLARAQLDVRDDAGATPTFLDGVTQAGVLVGTPAYMAPEQFHGAPSDPRADQYAFCTAMYEAFYGELPFVASDVRALCALKKTGKVPDPPHHRGGGVAPPRELLAVIRRGLSADPADRFAAMPDVLRELRRIGEQGEQVAAASPSRSSWWIALVLVLVAVVVLLAT
jgi:serine/threonine protein kinase